MTYVQRRRMKQRAIQRNKKRKHKRDKQKLKSLGFIAIVLIVLTILSFVMIEIRGEYFRDLYMNIGTEIFGLWMAILYIEFFVLANQEIVDEWMDRFNEWCGKIIFFWSKSS